MYDTSHLFYNPYYEDDVVINVINRRYNLSALVLRTCVICPGPTKFKHGLIHRLGEK